MWIYEILYPMIILLPFFFSNLGPQDMTEILLVQIGTSCTLKKPNLKFIMNGGFYFFIIISFIFGE